MEKDLPNRLKISININRFDSAGRAYGAKLLVEKKAAKDAALKAYNQAKDKYDLYKKNLDIIKSWKTTLEIVLSDLTSAHSSFISGGYVASGETFQEKDYNEMLKMDLGQVFRHKILKEV